MNITGALFAAAAVLLAGCSGRNSAGTPTETDPSVLRLSGDAAQHVSVVHPAVEESFNETTLGGRVEFNPNLVTRMYSLVNGTIARVLVNQGAFVHRGDELADITSGDYAAAVSDFQKASAQLKIARKNSARARELADAKIVSDRELQQAASDSAQAQAEFDRAANVLRLLDASRDSASAIYRMRAPIDGTILERLAQAGSQVRSDNSQILFTIGRITAVWITLDVYPDQIHSISVGDKAVLRFDGLEDTAVTTSIRYISPVLDQVTLTAKARCEVENPRGMIKPAMFCSATVYHRTGNSMFLPASSAFYDNNGKSYVFACLDAGKYQKREVRLGRMTPEKVEVLTGISLRDAIVANDALFLDEELQQSGK